MALITDRVRPLKLTGPTTSKGQAGFTQTIPQEPGLGKIRRRSDGSRETAFGTANVPTVNKWGRFLSPGGHAGPNNYSGSHSGHSRNGGSPRGSLYDPVAPSFEREPKPAAGEAPRGRAACPGVSRPGGGASRRDGAERDSGGVFTCRHAAGHPSG